MNKKQQNEETQFLSLCSPHDQDLLTGKCKMNLQDFERINYLTMSLNLNLYAIALHNRYTDCTKALLEREDIVNEIMEDDMSYLIEEEIEKRDKWAMDFVNQLPKCKQKYYAKLLQIDMLYD